MQRILAIIILCQKLDNKIPEFKANIPKTFGLKDFNLKAGSVPPQSDGNMNGVIVLMDIYQIYIQGKSVKECIVQVMIKSFETYSITQYSPLWLHCWKKNKEIKDKERNSQKDINKEKLILKKMT